MGIKKFFKKVGGWFKDKFHAAKTGVQKFAKVVKEKVVPVVQKGVNFIGNTPIGGIINGFTGGAFDKARKLINLIPGGKVKEKAEEYVNKAEDARNKVVNEIDKRQDQARDLIDKGRGIMDRLKEGMNIVVGGKGSYPSPEARAQMAEKNRQLNEAMAKASGQIMRAMNM